MPTTLDYDDREQQEHELDDAMEYLLVSKSSGISIINMTKEEAEDFDEEFEVMSTRR